MSWLSVSAAFAATLHLMGPLRSADPIVVAQAPATPATSPTPKAEANAATAPSQAKGTGKTDAKLDALVDSIQKTYDGTRTFKGQFLQRYTYTLLHRTQESKGSVVFEKPGRMRWDYKEPQAKSFIVDGKSLWIYQPVDKVAYVNACFQQDGLTASVAFLWGQGKLKEQFDISWFDGVFGDKSDHHLLLSPRSANSIFARLILVVDPKSSRVKQSIVVDPAGNVNQFVYSGLSFNAPVDASTFAFTPPPGINTQRMPGTCPDAVAGVP